MTYRDDRSALLDQIRWLETQAADRVSPAELAAFRREVEQAKARLAEEGAALDTLLARIEAHQGPDGRRRRLRLRFGLLGLALVLVLAIGAIVILYRQGPPEAPRTSGMPGAVTERIGRGVIDREVMRLLPELEACLPRGWQGRIQADIVFEGNSGSIKEAYFRNGSERASYTQEAVTCLKQTFFGIGSQRFRAPSYLYRLTLVWDSNGLQPPPLLAPRLRRGPPDGSAARDR